MKFDTSLLLTENEKTILDLLQKRGGLSFTEISSYSDIPRTTLYKPIRDLEKRSFIRTEKRGRDRLVFIKKEIKNRQSESPKEFTILNEKEYLHVMYDVPHIKNGDRVFWLQPSLALKSILKSEHISLITNLNKKILQSKCIMDGILEIDYYDVYMRMVGELNFKKAVKSLLGRPYEIHMSRKPFEDKKEIIIFPTYAIAFDWQSKTGIKSESRVFIDLCKTYFDSIKKESKKIDVSELLKSFLK